MRRMAETRTRKRKRRMGSNTRKRRRRRETSLREGHVGEGTRRNRIEDGQERSPVDGPSRLEGRGGPLAGIGGRGGEQLLEPLLADLTGR